VPASETIRIPAREGRGVTVRAGERVRVIDPEGGQVADVFAFAMNDPSEYHSAEHTRVHVGRLFPLVGEQFVTNRRRPILTLEADDSPGIHDMLFAACDPTRYQGLGVEGWHASCQENLLDAMRQLGVERVEVPQPINLFMNIPVGADAEVGVFPAQTRPGDSTTLRAEVDCYVVVSACPQDLVQINAGKPGPIDVEITRA
jgi:uncharacterized protein YcgI (DUF1989 family)